MTEQSFVNLYARDFVSLATRDPDGAGLEEALARKVAEARDHAALMDARKGEGHVEAIAAALEAQAARPAAHAFRSHSEEEWAARAAFLRRSAALLRQAQGGPAVSKRSTRLGLRVPSGV
jgi:hypothetical protein